MKIQDYINEQNESIWKELSQSYKIELIHEPKEWSWKINTEDPWIKKIITPTREIEISSFSHELLHLYIDHMGMTTPKEILHSIYGELSFQVLTKNGLFSILHNFCSHKKMFPFFIEMGFNEKDFISFPAKFGYLTRLTLKSKMIQKQAVGVTDFIGNTLALMNNMGSSNEKYNSKKLKKLNAISSSLFSIIEVFDQSWANTSDYDIIPSFIIFEQELNEWLINNKIKFSH
ncbi:MAG: hypothetical protein RIA69_01895 [Cyclobacteriaceae bacterium]